MSLQPWEPAQASPEVPVNDNFVALGHMAVYAMNAKTTAGLTWGYLGGRWTGFEVTAGTLTLAADAVSYLTVDRATGEISASTDSAAWDDVANHARVYRLTTGPATVLEGEDWRAGTGGVHGMAATVGDLGIVLEGLETDVPAETIEPTDTVLQAFGKLQSQVNNGTGGGGDGRLDINLQSATTAYTLQASDANKCVEMDNAAVNQVTIPPNSAVAFAVGTKLYVRQVGAGITRIRPGAGVTLRNPHATGEIKAQWGMVMLHKRATNEWAVEGNFSEVSRVYDLVQTETFASAPAGSDYSVRDGSPTVTWESGTQSLLIALAAGNGSFIAWDKWGGFTGKLAFEADIQFVSDASGIKHFGMFLDSGTSGRNGYRVANNSTNMPFSTWVGSTETNLGNFSTATAFNVGSTYTLRVERNEAGEFAVFINGTKQPNTFTNNAFGALRPGFFVYGASIRVNELRVYQ